MNKEQQENREDLIDLTQFFADYWRMFTRMWKIVLLLACAGALVLGIRANVSYRALYTASSTFTVNIAQNESGTTSSYFGNVAAEQMAKTFPYVLTSGVLQNKVAETLSVDSVPGSIKVTAEENTNLLTLSVTDIDAERAYRTLQAVITHYPSVSESIVGKVYLHMLDETEIPTEPDNPKDIRREVAKGALAGAAAGLVLIGIFAFFNQTIRREEDCAKRINQRCLGTVPKLKRKKRSREREEYSNIVDPNIQPDFTEAFRIIRNKVEYSARENNLKTILVSSTLVNEGKSTVAVNLALSLAQNGKRVALIDCDLRNPTDNKILKIEERKGLADYLRGEIRLNQAILYGKEAGFQDYPKLLYVPGGSTVEDDAELLDSPQMEHMIRLLEEEADYVILDSAPLGLLVDARVLAQYADGLVLVVKKDFARADFIFQGLEQVAEYHVHTIGCVLNEG